MSASRFLFPLTFGVSIWLFGCTSSSDNGAGAVNAGVARECADAGDAGDPNRERHGSDCLCCHSGQFGVAGSVAQGGLVARVIVGDGEGNVADMVPDAYDNFFQHLRLQPPLTARVVFVDGSEQVMPGTAPHGSCNACHALGGKVPPVGSR